MLNPTVNAEYPDKPWSWPIPTVADALGVTPRRVSQYIEAGDIPRLSRGRIDFAWALYFTRGSKATENLRIFRPTNPLVLVCIGWLQLLGQPETAGDREALALVFERNGFTREEALISLGQARTWVRR